MNSTKSTTRHNFASIQKANTARSVFNLSRTRKQTFDVDYLVPFFAEEVLPGDVFTVKHTILARLNTPIVPIMDNMYLDTFYFYVPNRQVWNNWKKFYGEQDNPGDSVSYLIPQVAANAATGWLEGELFDYLGLPINEADANMANLECNALHSRAYNLIYNEWFRDENLIGDIVVDKDDGPDVATDYVLKKRGKRKDYFTGALPWPQKGTAVPLPLSGNAPIVLSSAGSTYPSTTLPELINATTGVISPGVGPTDFGVDTNANLTDLNGVGADIPLQIDPNGAWVADMSSATAATLNEFRLAVVQQQFLELWSRGGSRYNEIVYNEFGSVIPDLTLQRPELLNLSSNPIHITPIAQTSESATTPQGTLAAMGTVVARNGFSKGFTEHGVILGLLCVRADLTYQQGMRRMWNRRTLYDFFHPLFEGLGEQAILKKEIMALGVAGDEGVWGYQERFAEYKFGNNEICGALRSKAATPLDMWHLAQELPDNVALNETFINETMPIDRVVAVTSEPDFVMDSRIDVKAARPMRVFGTPGLVRL